MGLVALGRNDVVAIRTFATVAAGGVDAVALGRADGNSLGLAFVTFFDVVTTVAVHPEPSVAEAISCSRSRIITLLSLLDTLLEPVDLAPVNLITGSLLEGISI